MYYYNSECIKCTGTREKQTKSLCEMNTSSNFSTNMVRWSSGSTIGCKSRGLWFESYPGLM